MAVLFFRDLILVAAALNLVANPALGLMILLHWPHEAWLFPKRWSDRRRETLDTKTKEKGE
jgi:hypothetical protein